MKGLVSTIDIRPQSEDNTHLNGFQDMIVVISFAVNSYCPGTFWHMEILVLGCRVSNLLGKERLKT